MVLVVGKGVLLGAMGVIDTHLVVAVALLSPMGAVEM
jgi:hypothetical protein